MQLVVCRRGQDARGTLHVPQEDLGGVVLHARAPVDEPRHVDGAGAARFALKFGQQGAQVEDGKAAVQLLSEGLDEDAMRVFHETFSALTGIEPDSMG